MLRQFALRNIIAHPADMNEPTGVLVLGLRKGEYVDVEINASRGNWSMDGCRCTKRVSSPSF